MQLFPHLLLCSMVLAVPLLCADPPAGTEPLVLTVDGVQRTALVHMPPASAGKALPLVFVFHGHGGSAANAVGSFAVQRLWPEAISVYPQGLNIPSITDAEGTRAGWQHDVGEVGDQDLHFFDALLVQLKKEYPVDLKRVYATGHSNGGGFTYLLWKARPDVFAAVAPCSAAPKFTAELTSKPAMLSGGRQDPIVKFARQQEEVDAVRKINGCEGAGEPWESGLATLYSSRGGTPLVTFFYEGGHAMAAEEAGLIVKFFRQHAGQ